MSPADHYRLAAFFTFMVNLSLVLFVKMKGGKNPLANRFIVYGSAIVLWSVSVFLTASSKDYNLAYIFSQTTHVGAALIPILFLHFVYDYLNIDGRRVIIKFFYVVTILFLISIIFFRGLFFGIPGVQPKLTFPYFPNVGPLYTPWVTTFFAMVCVAHLQLLLYWLRSSDPIRKNQVRFFFFANLLGYLGGLGCFLPVYSLPYFPFPFGSYGVVFFSVVTAYSVFKYRFIDIDVFIKRTLVFAGLFVFWLGITSLVMLVSTTYLSKVFVVNIYSIMALSILFVVGFYEPMRVFLVDLTDRFLFQRKYSYHKLLKENAK